jgi:hypothetical protein
MLHWIKGNGIENIFSLDVYSEYGSTITSQTSDSPTVQYLPKSTMFVDEPDTFYMNIVSQLTQEVTFLKIGDETFTTPLRSKQFYLYIDNSGLDQHIDLDNGLYDYSVYWGLRNATSIDSTQILAELTNGIAMVHDENWLNKEYQNSPNGVTETIIPNSISYNG